MLLAPLRRKRDELAAEVKRTSDIPKFVIEDFCNGKTVDYIIDGDFIFGTKIDDYQLPNCWDKFVEACDAVAKAEQRELSLALGR